MTDKDSSTLQAPRLPIEVFEFVIEAIHEFSSVHFHPNCATLRACALVCHAWRPRSQTVLFRTVELADSRALYRFAAHLDAVPRLAGHVRQLMLVSRSLHGADSIVAHFASVLTGRLPNLVFLDFWRIFEDETWHPDASRTPVAVGPQAKELPCMPLHPRFPDILAAFSGRRITELELVSVVFPSFGDLARVLHGLVTLRSVFLHTVSWTALGAYPSCMSGAAVCRPCFLPYLQVISMASVSAHGPSRLLSALGASLGVLEVDFPYFDPKVSSVNSGQNALLNLKNFLNLHTVRLWLRRSLKDHRPSLLVVCEDMLRSWAQARAETVRHPGLRLIMEPSFASDFTREEFAEVLAQTCATVERVFYGTELPSQDKAAASKTSAKGRGDLFDLVVKVYDSNGMQDWWTRRILHFLLHLEKWAKLEVRCCMPYYEDERWKDYAVDEPAACSAVPTATADGILAT